MQLSSTNSSAIASASVGAGSGSNSAAEIAKLQKQMKNLTNELKNIAGDTTMDAKAKQKRAEQLQAQIQLIQQQITAIQQADAQKAQDKAQRRTEAARESNSPPSSSLSARKEGPLGTRACHQPNPECGARPWYLSCQPNHSSGKVDSAQEVARRLVVACGNSTVLFEPGKKVLNEVALLVQVLVVAARLLAVAARGDHDSFAFALQRLDQALLCVVGFISDNAISLGVLKQDVRPFKIMALPGREVKTGRIAQGIDCGVNLRAQTASAAPDSLFLRIPPFAPALCWWARTMVESIMAYSLSASCANASKTRCQTPVLLQREWRVCTTRKSPKCSGKSRQGMPAR